MADDAAVLIGVGAIVVAAFGVWWVINRQQALGGGGGGLFGGLGGGGTGGTGGGTSGRRSCITDCACVQSRCPAGDRSCTACWWLQGTQTPCNPNTAEILAFGNACAARGGGGGGTTTTPNCGDCNHLNCAGVRACLNRCPPFNPSVLNACGIQNIGGSIITPGTGSTGGRPTTGGAIIPCIVDEATRRSRCPNLCSCSAAWFYQGTNTPCSPTGAEVAARADQCGIPASRGGSVTPGFDISAGNANNPVSSSFVHRPLYNRVFFSPLDQMRLVIS